MNIIEIDNLIINPEEEKITYKEQEIELQTLPGDIRDVEDSKKFLLKAIEEGTEPTKPVKTFAAPEPTSILSLYFRMGGGTSQRLASAISGVEDPVSQIRKTQKL